MRRRRSFNRPLGQRRYRRLFVISIEGSKTERQYFYSFNSSDSVIRVKCITPPHSSPLYVLKCMEDYLESEGLRASDEAWLVADKDSWSEGDLIQLYNWSKTKQNYGFALSNPNFEYWLLLHFEPGNNISSAKECKERLKRYIPNYDKNVNPRIITRERIEQAIDHAKTRDCPPCVDWPRTPGKTTVYRLVEKILGT